MFFMSYVVCHSSEKNYIFFLSRLPRTNKTVYSQQTDKAVRNKNRHDPAGTTPKKLMSFLPTIDRFDEHNTPWEVSKAKQHSTVSIPGVSTTICNRRRG